MLMSDFLSFNTTVLAARPSPSSRECAAAPVRSTAARSWSRVTRSAAKVVSALTCFASARSATLPYATADRQTLVATAQRQVIDPLELGPVRLVGVSLGGLTSVRQGSLFPDLDQGDVMLITEDERPEVAPAPIVPVVADAARWRPGQDVAHREFGHGWVQGCGHGVVTVRFETRSTGPGLARTFAEDDDGLARADPEASLH